MNKLYKIILILTGVIFLFSGCSRDPIREVLKNVEGVPRKEKDRSINWYKIDLLRKSLLQVHPIYQCSD